MTDILWLPAIVCFDDYGKIWDPYIEVLYQYFKVDFIDNQPHLLDQTVGLKHFPADQQKHPTFWHIISEGPLEEDRTPDLKRCERIRWPSPIIEHQPAEVIRCWEEGNDILLWLTEDDYLIVLGKRNGYIILRTAYCVNYPHRRRNLSQRYETSLKKQTPPSS